MPAPTFRKSDTNIGSPPGNPTDLASGMQWATVNGTIGYADDTAATELPGANIGAAIDPAFHVRVA